MQRKLLLTALSLITAQGIVAQPTLTATNNSPQAGDTYTIHQTGTVNPGASGANVTWDFSNVSSTGSVTASYIPCSSAPNCASFSGANLVSSQAAGQYGYYISDNSKMAIRGIEAGSVVIDYSDAEEMTRYPFTYNNTYTDNFAATFTSGVTFNRSGAVVVTADGYGTLKLPSATFNNVLRVRRQETYQDVSTGFPNINYVSDIYAWYSPNIREFIFSITSLTINGGASQTTVQYINHTPSAINDLSGLEATLRVYPNPVRDQLQVDFKTEARGNIDISLLDLTGRALSSIHKELTQGVHHETIRTGDLARGMYLLRIQGSGGHTLTRKIEVL